MPSRSGIHIEGDAADFLQELSKVIQKTKEHERELKKLTGETNKLTKEEKQLAREMKRAYDDVRGPQQRYEMRMKALNELVHKGSITQKEYSQAARRAQEQLQRTGRAGMNAFGPQALQQVLTYAGGVLGISRAISLATQAMSEMQQAREEIAEKQREARDPFGQLQQVATSREDYLALVAKSRTLFKRGAATDLPTAAQTIFALRSAEQLKTEYTLFDQLGRSRLFGDPSEIAEAAAALTTSLGQKETGTLRQLLSKALAASGKAPAQAQKLLVAAATSGGVSKTLGISDEELLAAVAVSSKAAKGAELGGQRVKRMLISMEEAGLREGTLLKRLEKIEGAGGVQAGARYRKFFGRQLGRQAYSDIIGNIALYQQALGEISEANRRDLVAERGVFYTADPAQLAATQRAEAEAREEISRHRLGVREQRFRTDLANMKTTMREGGIGEWEIWWSQAMARLGGWMGGPEQGRRAVLNQLQFSSEGPLEITPGKGVEQDLREAASDLRGAAAELRQRSRQRPVQTTE